VACIIWSKITSWERDVNSRDETLVRLETHQRLVSAIYVSFPRRYLRPNYTSHIKKWAKSVVAIYGSVNPNRLMHYLLTVDGSCKLMTSLFTSAIRGGSRNFGKGGLGKRANTRTERRKRERRRGASPENFEKLDAISCNLAYIFGIRMASDIIQNGAFAEQKTVAATISIYTHICIHPPHFQKLLGFRPL